MSVMPESGVRCDRPRRLAGRRQAHRSPDSRLHWVCPFCGRLCDALTALSWCSGCFVEYSTSGLFDASKKTPRFALAKAVQKSGGLRIGADESRGGG